MKVSKLLNLKRKGLKKKKSTASFKRLPLAVQDQGTTREYALDLILNISNLFI